MGAEGEGSGAGLAQLRKSNLQSQKELKRLREEMESLRKDNETLEQQLAQAQGTYGHRPGTGTGGAASGAGKRIQRARDVDSRKDNVTSLEGKVGAEEGRIRQFDEKLVSMREQIMEVRRQMGSVNITKESNEMVDKQIRVLENRLDKALVKFNEALHVNKELREQIDNLRRERGVFDTIYKKLERELQEKKKEMAFIIEVSNIAYEERDNAQSELQQLKVYASKEMQSFEETFKELDELLDEDRKMKAAIKLRMNERRTDLLRSTTDLEASKGKRKGTPNTNTRQTTSAGGAGNGPSGADMTAQNYEEVFNALKTATNTTDITTLVEKFMHSEDDNFSLFNFVNELNTEIEKLEEQRSEIKTEMDSIKASAGVQGDQGRQAALKQLEERLNREEQNSKRYGTMADKTSKLLEQAMGCVSKLFDVLECEESRIVEQQGTAGLSENTIHLYLAAIELKSDEHLARWRRLHGASDRGPAFPFGSTNITIDIPSTGDEYYDGYSDEEDRVLTREELLLKTSQKLAKQQQAGGERSRAKKGKKKAGLV